MPVSCGRGLSSEKIASSPRDEELDPENAVAAEIVDDRARHVLRLRERRGGHRHRLPALPIVALLLAVADRRAEGDAVRRADGEQGDLIVEGDELLDDHPRPVAAHVGDGIVPGGVQLGLGRDRALALAGRGHDRLHHAGQAGVRRRRPAPPRGSRRSGSARCAGRASRRRASRIASRFIVVARGAGGRDDVPALGLQRDQLLGADRLDLGHDMIGPVLLDRGAQRGAVEHREDLARVGDLHRRRAGIGIAGDDIGAEPLGRDDELAAELARAEQQDFGGEGHAAGG